MFMTFKILSSIVRMLRHIARFEEYVTGLIDSRLVTFGGGQRIPRSVRDFRNAEFVLRIQIGNVPRDKLL
jgi:hypothetical protein